MINACEYCADHDFEIEGVSYIGAPRDNTAMFCMAKLAPLLQNLEGANHCLVFVEAGMEPPAQLAARHCFVESALPAAEYGRLTQKLWAARHQKNAARAYTTMPGGYTLGQNVQLGSGVYIEPGALIGHDVAIGDGTLILAGAKVKNAVVGKNCIIKENAVVGCMAFTLYADEAGDHHRLYNLGTLEIADEVEIGACATVCQGSAGTTVLGHHVKLDDHVYIAHDVQCAPNVRMAASVAVGGYTTIGQGCFLGFGAMLRNRLAVGAHATIGMGSVVVKDVPENATVYGSPARQHG